MSASDARPREGGRLFCTACGEYGHLNTPCPAASDARPPSDPGATGWHTHSGGRDSAWRDGSDWDCEHIAGPSRPVLVVDPAEAQETIARAMFGLVSDHAWETCTIRDLYLARADTFLANLAALADQART